MVLGQNKRAPEKHLIKEKMIKTAVHRAFLTHSHFDKLLFSVSSFRQEAKSGNLTVAQVLSAEISWTNHVVEIENIESGMAFCAHQASDKETFFSCKGPLSEEHKAPTTKEEYIARPIPTTGAFWFRLLDLNAINIY